MRIAIAQINYHIGHFEYNLNNICRAVDEANAQDADVVVLGELSICGYPPRDFLEFDDFIDRCEQSIERLLPFSHKAAIIVGGPARNPEPDGKALYNSAYLLHKGEIIHRTDKTLLPNYDIFDEYRYFEPNTLFETVEFKGHKLAITICEDLWNIGNDNPLYKVNPMDHLSKLAPDVILNLSASPFSVGRAAVRRRVMSENAMRYGIPLFYTNHIGAQTEIIFDGGSMVVSPDGYIHDEMPFFERQVKTYDLEAVHLTAADHLQDNEPAALRYQALVCGIREYFTKLGFGKAILGLSGGIDSAVTAVLAADALGPENVLGVLMPSKFSSQHSIDDAMALVFSLGIQHRKIPIETMNSTTLDVLATDFEGTPFGLAEENIQSRCRGQILMALSNKFGHILLNTSNKSEMAVGYGTLYGDLCGGLSVLGDLYKTEVYQLAALINKNEERIPQNSLIKPPSAELKPGQLDSDSLPEYEELDAILRLYIEGRKGPREIIAAGFRESTVSKVLKLVNTSEFKRYQTPPVLRVSSKAFGMGRRMPIVARYLN